MLKNSFSNPSELSDADIAEIQNEIAQAKDESYQFGTALESIFSGLVVYKKNDRIPFQYWDLSAKLFDSVSVGSTVGDFVFTETQSQVMSKVYAIMKTKGLAITLPDEESLIQILSSTLDHFSYSKLLEKIYFPLFIKRSGQTIEANYFLNLTLGTVGVISEILNNEKLLSETVGESDALRIKESLQEFMILFFSTYPDTLSKIFWDNPEVLEYHKNMRRAFLRDFLGLLGIL